MSARLLDRYLTKRGLTNAAFAAELGVFKGTVGHWRKGTKVPTVVNVFLIEKLTGGAVPASGWSPLDNQHSPKAA